MNNIIDCGPLVTVLDHPPQLLGLRRAPRGQRYIRHQNRTDGDRPSALKKAIKDGKKPEFDAILWDRMLQLAI